MRMPRRALLILAVAILAVAVPTTLAVGAAGDSGPAGASKKKPKTKTKKCKKGFQKVKGKCKKKKKPAAPETPAPPIVPGIVPKIGEYNGDAIMKNFKLSAYSGAQGRVEFLAVAPAGGCKFKTDLAMLVGDRGEPLLVKDNKFAGSATFSDEFGGYTDKVEGVWTSSTTVEGTVELSETYNGETCVTGPQKFTATAK
jgi:hypothetical protein